MILPILSIIAGIAFTVAGIYFLSGKFQEKTGSFRAKGTAYTAIALGALTFTFAVMLLLFPAIKDYLALAYMVLLCLAFGALFLIYK